MLNIGIIGLEGSGKTSLFRALTRGIKASGKSSMATVPVPDERLDVLTNMVKPKRTVPTGAQFVDVGAVSRGASDTGGLGAQFLSSLQGVEALAVMLRFFPTPDVGSGPGLADPINDLEGLILELSLSDLSRVDKRLEKTAKAAKGPDAKAKREEVTLLQLRERLDAGKIARGVDASPEDLDALKDLGLLTLKPMIYVANVAESDLAPALNDMANDPNGIRGRLADLRKAAEERGAEVAIVSAEIEAELGELSNEDALDYLASIGVGETGLNRFIRSAYGLLSLLTFFTAGEPEVKAWTVRSGAKAPEAAGQIHSDIERGFIRAEVTAWADLIEAGSQEAAKRANKTRLEGKDYLMKEGDVVYFRFNV